MRPLPHTPESAQSTDPASLERLFSTTDVLPLWIAEPSLAIAPSIVAALTERAELPWYGYEIRPDRLIRSFWTWMEDRHGWDGAGLRTLVSPSVGTSIGVVLDRLSAPGDGVVAQPPVFTDFKTLVASAGRRLVKNPLRLDGDRYTIDLEALDAALAADDTTVMILCNPHNPVGRAWTAEELRGIAVACARHGVLVIADEIHADLVLPGQRFTPFAVAAEGTGARWAALHGPIKTFGLAGVCDTLLITEDDVVAEAFQTASNQLHLTRNNVFALTAFAAAYERAGAWVDDLLALVADNAALLHEGLDHGLRVIPAEATYLAWLDLRVLGLEAHDLVAWMAGAGVAMSPGHWFGREGAGFARLTTAVPTTMVQEAIERLNRAASEGSTR